MNRTSAKALAIARPIILGLTVLNVIYGAGIAVLLASSIVRPDWPWAPLGIDVHTASPSLPLGLRSIMVIGLVAISIVHLILRRLRAIVDTVRGGDPFNVANTRRLHAIAWFVLAIEGLRLMVSAIAHAVTTPGHPMTMGDGFSFAPWLAVLLLFVLAGVFAQGARMRDDLDGTV
jgi:hypothetical protein